MTSDLPMVACSVVLSAALRGAVAGVELAAGVAAAQSQLAHELLEPRGLLGLALDLLENVSIRKHAVSS